VIQVWAIETVHIQVFLEGLIEHLVLPVVAFAIWPARRLLIPIVVEGLNRLILVIVNDLGVVGFREYDSPVWIGGLHCFCLNNKIIGSILEVGVNYAEVRGIQVYCHCVIGIGIVIASIPAPLVIGVVAVNIWGCGRCLLGFYRFSFARLLPKSGWRSWLGKREELFVRRRNEGVDSETSRKLRWVECRIGIVAAICVAVLIGMWVARIVRVWTVAAIAAICIAILIRVVISPIVRVGIVVIMRIPPVPVKVEAVCIIKMDGSILETDLEVVGVELGWVIFNAIIGDAGSEFLLCFLRILEEVAAIVIFLIA
jgi:hypothetical protein